MAIKKKKKKLSGKSKKKLPVKKKKTLPVKKVVPKKKKTLPVKKVVPKKKKKLPVKKVVTKKKKKLPVKKVVAKKLPTKKLSLKQKLLAEKKQILSKRRLTKADRSRIKVIDKALKKIRLAEKKETERIIQEEADKQALAKAKRKKARILSTARRRARLSTEYLQVEPEKIPYIKTRPLPEPEPEPETEIPFYFIETGAAAMYSEPGMNDEEHYQYASNMNAASLDRMTIEGTSRVASVFERAFIGALNKGPFEADEIHIYRHGIIIRPRLGEFTDSNRKAINNLLVDYPGSSVHVTREPGSDGSKDTFSIRINVGSSTVSSNFSNTSENIDYHKEVFQSIYSYITDNFGDSEWSGFWDTEESMYE